MAYLFILSFKIPFKYCICYVLGKILMLCSIEKYLKFNGGKETEGLR